MLIAIIEDEADISRLYKVILEDAGHTVVNVDQHQLDHIGSDVDCVIFDVMMPDVDGTAVVDYLAERQPAVRKIAATAIYQVPARIKAIADIILTKPFSPDELLEALG